MKFDDEINLHVVRGGICVHDDMDTHYLKLSFQRYDCPSIINLLRMISVWLIDTQNAVWSVTMGNNHLGKIIVKDGECSFELESELEIWQMDTTKKVTCFLDKIL